MVSYQVKFFLFIVVFLASLAGAPRVFADYTYYSTEVESTFNMPETTGGGNEVWIRIGNGFSGTLTGLDLYTEEEGSFWYYISSRICDDAAYTSCNTSGIINQEFPSDTTDLERVRHFSSGQDAIGTYTFDPTKYYMLELRGGGAGGGQVARLHGNSEPEQGQDCVQNCGGVESIYLVLEGVNNDLYEDLSERTRIVDFYPHDMSTTSSPVTFDLEVYINEEDLGFLSGVRLEFNYQKQPVGIPHQLLSTNATTSGYLRFTYTETLDNGNYIVNAQILNNYVGGIFVNPFGNELTSQFHQFIVGQGTFLGNFFQGAINEIDEGLASTTISFGDTCSPLSYNFSMSLCVLGLILPSTEALNTQITNMRNQAPIGWGFRLYDILNGTATSSATTSLPTITYNFGSTSPFVDSGFTGIEFDPFGAMEDLNNIASTTKSDQTNQKNIRQIMETTVELIVYLSLGFLIMRKIFKFHT